MPSGSSERSALWTGSVSWQSNSAKPAGSSATSTPEPGPLAIPSAPTSVETTGRCRPSASITFS